MPFLLPTENHPLLGWSSNTCLEISILQYWQRLLFKGGHTLLGPTDAAFYESGFLLALKTGHRKKIKKSLKSLLPPSITILTVMKPLAHTGI
ncbi:hypothetical protein SAMN05192562_104445 [Kosakonia arachidis]|uniref:Uncharacterized protein n=1 Tax=Kosakonia arachidis TaxID=551989 RepID=A0A1I7D6C5_9ENTR|nr:hypothetical protein [Kosakonia arachidis]SFU07124.1 hypothetical protein SAMN05192562_104445 [Kosakonia arachidis]